MGVAHHASEGPDGPSRVRGLALPARCGEAVWVRYYFGFTLSVMSEHRLLPDIKSGTH